MALTPARRKHKVLLENEIYLPASRRGELPCRTLSNVAIYDAKVPPNLAAH